MTGFCMAGSFGKFVLKRPLPMKVHTNGEAVVVECPDLNLVAHGGSFRDALKALERQFESTVEEYLLSAGKGATWKDPDFGKRLSEYVVLPRGVEA